MADGVVSNRASVVSMIGVYLYFESRSSLSMNSRDTGIDRAMNVMKYLNPDTSANPPDIIEPRMDVPVVVRRKTQVRNWIVSVVEGELEVFCFVVITFVKTRLRLLNSA